MIMKWGLTYGYNVTRWMTIDGSFDLPKTANRCDDGGAPGVLGRNRQFVSLGTTARIRPIQLIQMLAASPSSSSATAAAPVGHALNIGLGFEGWFLPKKSYDENHFEPTFLGTMGYEYRAHHLSLIVEVGGHFVASAATVVPFLGLAGGASF